MSKAEIGLIVAIPREMKWGETPWDDMSREQLVREVQRMYSALVEARGVINLAKLTDEREYPNTPSPYWNAKDGVGRHAMEKVRQALAIYDSRLDDIYRAFFRYADDLLFDGKLGFNWMIGRCGDIVGDFESNGHQICPLCKANGKGEIPMRPITWDDLKRQ